VLEYKHQDAGGWASVWPLGQILSAWISFVLLRTIFQVRLLLSLCIFRIYVSIL